MAEASNQDILECRVKWFNPKKGFGFLVPTAGGPDILLHANVLRNAGRGSIAENVIVKATTSQVDGRWQAVAIEAVLVETGQAVPRLEQFVTLDPEALRSLPFQPARVKWFDPIKGFGFANAFGSIDDIFIHIEVLRASGLAGLETGEAVALRVIDGERGRMAAEVAEWDQKSL
jgi:cold shock protein